MQVTHSAAPRTHRPLILVVTSLGHFVNDGMVFFVPVIADLISNSQHVKPLYLAIMLTIFYVASALSGLIVGRLADLTGRRAEMIALGIFALSLGIVIYFFATLYTHGLLLVALIFLGAGVAGVGSAFYHPIGGSMLQITFGNTGAALGLNGAFGSLGRALYPTIFFGLAALLASSPRALLALGVLGFLAAGIVWVASTFYALGSMTNRQQGSAAGAPQTQLSKYNVLKLTIIAFLRSIAFIGVTSWLPIYLSVNKHIGVSSSLGFILTAMYAGGILGQPLFGIMSEKYDKRYVLGATSLGSGIAILAYVLGSGPLAIVALVAFGGFTFSSFPLLLSLVSDYVPRNSTALGNAFVWGLGTTGGQAIGPLIVGLLIEGSYKNLDFAFIVMSALAIVTGFMVPLLEKAAKPSKAPLFG